MSGSAERLRVAATSEPDEEKRRIAEMKPKDQIAYLLDKRKGEIAKLLPSHLNPERLLKVATIAATTTPALVKCDVASLVAAIGQCAQIGLEPNTILGHAYLVPFNTKRKDADGNERWVNSVQVIVGYKGLIDLARRSGQIVSIAAHEVCKNDEFDLVYGLKEDLRHKPALGDRGDVLGFYAIAHLVGGGHAFEWLSVAQVEKIRDASQGWQQAIKFKKQDIHPWAQHFVEMGRKTAIRRLAKYLPLSIEFQRAANLDEQATLGKDQRLDAIDGDFLNVPEAMGTEGGESADADAQGAITDDTQAQEASRVPQQTAAAQQPEPAAAPARATSKAKAQAAPKDDVLTPKQRALDITERVLGIADDETAYLTLDDARFMASEMGPHDRADVEAAIERAATALKARRSGGQMLLD